jgi:hypothetical protein
MRELVQLQVDQHIAAQQAVVEHQVQIVVVAVEREPLLAGFEQEALTQLQQEILQSVDDGLLQVRLRIATFFFQPQELQNIRLLEEVFRLRDDLAFLRKTLDPILVPAQSQPFVQAGGLLTLQLCHGPALMACFDFVETALVEILDREEFDVVGPAQCKEPCEFNRRCLPNLNRA